MVGEETLSVGVLEGGEGSDLRTETGRMGAPVREGELGRGQARPEAGRGLRGSHREFQPQARIVCCALSQSLALGGGRRGRMGTAWTTC